jgi:hypothetical protein
MDKDEFEFEFELSYELAKPAVILLTSIDESITGYSKLW